jgi:hypothetical protein
MTDTRAQEVVEGYDRLKGDRGTWESHWQEVAERVWPSMAEMTGWRTPGEKRTELIFDSTPVRALPRFAAAMDSMLTPQTQKWHGLETGIPELDDNIEVRRWLEAVRDRMFRARYAPSANFASQMFECWMALGAFGTHLLFIDEIPGVTLRYRAIPLSEAVIDIDHQGRIDTVYRCFELTARQAVAVKEWQGKLPEQIVKSAEGSTPNRKFEFLHCVRPNDEYRQGMAGPQGMKWQSRYIAREGLTVLEESGYRTMPYSVGRYITGPREIYGRSPAMEALADIKSLNEMEKTMLRVGHRMVDPPLILMEDGALSPFSLRPNALNYGYLREDGEPLVKQLEMGGAYPIGVEMSDQKRKAINDSFLVTLFQILIEEPHVMTATEVLQRAQEKGALLGPTGGRQQSESLGPTIDRELDLLSYAGVLPPPPPVMQEYLASGGSVLPSYTGPLARLMKAEEATGILRTIEAIVPLAQVTGDLKVLRRINADESVKILAEANGVPAKALRSDEELEAMDAAEQEQQQMAQLLEAAPLAGQAAKSFAEAESIAASVPRRAVPGV